MPKLSVIYMWVRLKGKVIFGIMDGNKHIAAEAAAVTYHHTVGEDSLGL